MIRTGIVGLGFMGQQHFAIHQAMDSIQLLAICDKKEKRRAAQAEAVGGNIGEAQTLDLSALARYATVEELIANPDVDCVDICTPTYLHADMTVKALEAGKHVICEKPMALSADDCQRMIDAAVASGKLLLVAQCIRFWPAYEKLSEMIRHGELGRLTSAKFTRVSPMPTWSQDSWLLDNALSGGAVTDLHIHDVDFIISVFGRPKSLSTQAANRFSSGQKLDHAITQYFYGDFVCVAEGGWGFPGTWPFEMAFCVLGDEGCLEFSTAKSPMLTFYPMSGDATHPQVSDETGYQREFAYFAECLETGKHPDRVAPESAMESVRVVMAERHSAETGEVISL
jgi:predicted dehydrogenase